MCKPPGAAIEGLGGKVREHLYTLGEYDIVVVTEFPGDAHSRRDLAQAQPPEVARHSRTCV